MFEKIKTMFSPARRSENAERRLANREAAEAAAYDPDAEGVSHMKRDTFPGYRFMRR